MKKDLAEIVLVVDRSGSMRDIQDDAQGGVNALLEEQRKLPAGEAVVTLVEFDDQVDTLCEGKPIAEVEPYDLKPRGWTALLDAIGMTITRVGERLAATPEEERPEKVLFVVVTDGQENSSKEFDKAKVFDMIQHQTETYGWEFQFLATTKEAIADAQSYGFRKDMSHQYAASGIGVRKAYAATSQRLCRSRTGSK